MTFDMTRPIAKEGKLATQERDEETFVLTLADTKLHHLGDIETFLWKALDGSRTGKQLIDLVCAEYDADRTQVERDLPEFLSAMRAAGLISLSQEDHAKASG